MSRNKGLKGAKIGGFRLDTKGLLIYTNNIIKRRFFVTDGSGRNHGEQKIIFMPTVWAALFCGGYYHSLIGLSFSFWHRVNELPLGHELIFWRKS